MKTARVILLLLALGVLTPRTGFAGPSTETAPKAPAQKGADEAHSGKDEGRTHDKAGAPVTGHSTEKPENHQASPQPSGHPASKTDEKPSAIHDAKTHPQATASHRPNTSLTSGQKPGANSPNKVSSGNAIVQHPAGLNKPVATANSGLVAKKTGNASTRPVALSANKLPTSPSVNPGRGRAPLLAAIGGPAKPSVGNTAVISGTGIRTRP